MMAALFAGSVLTAEAQQKNASLAAVDKAESWKDADALRAKLAAEIQRQMKDLSPEQVRAFLSVEENRKLLLTYYLSCTEKDAKQHYRNYNEARARDLQQKRHQIENLSNEVKNKKGSEKKRASFQLENARSDLHAWCKA